MTGARLLSIDKAPHGDVYYIMANLRPADAEEAYALCYHDDPAQLAHECINHWGNYGWVVYHGDTPVAVLGATELWPRVWSAWMLATPDFSRIGLFVTRFIKRIMIPGLEQYGAVRADARSHVNHTWAHRWLEALGAQKEAVLKRYGKDGSDFVIYRWDSRML